VGIAGIAKFVNRRIVSSFYPLSASISKLLFCFNQTMCFSNISGKKLKIQLVCWRN